MTPFSTIVLSAELRGAEWVERPQLFSERLAAYLWSEHQIDRYHEAVQGYQQYLETALKPVMPAGPRWTIVSLGQGSEQTERSLFRKLLPHGTLFTQVDRRWRIGDPTRRSALARNDIRLNTLTAISRAAHPMLQVTAPLT